MEERLDIQYSTNNYARHMLVGVMGGTLHQTHFPQEKNPVARGKDPKLGFRYLFMEKNLHYVNAACALHAK